MIRRLAPVLLLVLLAASCNRSAEPELVTTLSLPPTTQATTTTTLETVTETSPSGDDITGYEVVLRTETDDGVEVWVVIEPGDYSDIDLEGLIIELVEAEDGLYQAHVFDDAEALDAARIEESARTAEEQALVDQHYLISLLEGSVVKFQGPFADFGEYVFGS